MIVKCSQCKFVYAESGPIHKQKAYDENYFQGNDQNVGYKDYEESYKSNIADFTKRLNDCEKRLGYKGVILDFGCAYGHFSYIAKQLGWQVVGCDISRPAVAHAKARYDVTGVVADICKLPFKNEQFDLIVLYDIIEHVSNPVNVLDQIKYLLRAGGLIHITTPDHSSLSANIMGSLWYHYKPFEHLVYFSKSSMQKALEKAGLTCRYVGAVNAQMSLGDISDRLKYYSNFIFTICLKILKRIGLSDFIISIPIGELQAWAEFNQKKKIDLVPSVIQINDESLYSLLACPDCAGELSKLNEDKIVCAGCSNTFPITQHVPILLPSE